MCRCDDLEAFTAGLLHQQAPEQLCSVYLTGQQSATGEGLVGWSMVIWLFGVNPFFVIPLFAVTQPQAEDRTPLQDLRSFDPGVDFYVRVSLQMKRCRCETDIVMKHLRCSLL
jgi:hypothetical protein